VAAVPFHSATVVVFTAKYQALVGFNESTTFKSDFLSSL
jgi:hypothetical protein